MAFSAAKAVKSRVVLLAGEEGLLRARAIQEILAACSASRDDFDLEFIDADASDPSHWIAAVGTAPFLAERRIVVVRRLLKADPDLAGGLGSLPETSLLVLVADEESSASETASRSAGTRRTKWANVVAAAGGHVELFKSDPAQVRDAVKKEAAGAGKGISDKAIDTLIEMTGGSLSRALDELGKLILFAGSNEQIRESDVREVVLPSREWNVFKMIDAVFGDSVPEALRQLRTLMGGQGKIEDAAIGRILPLVSRQLRLMWQARLCVDAGCSPGNPPESIRSQLPSKNSILEEKPYRQSSLTAAAKKASLQQIAACLRVLTETDMRLKGALPAFSAPETMERMILDMNQAMRPG